MKKIFFAVFAMTGLILSAQDQAVTVAEGAEFQIEKPDGDFQHILFPRKNFIIKRGGIANMNLADGLHVVVDRVARKGDRQVVILRRKDGAKFFRNFSTVAAYWPEAMQAGELEPSK
jgi:hypothetical protein